MKQLNKKLITFSLSCAFLIPAVFSQNQLATESSLYNEINSSYATGFIPGLLDKASEFEKKYPDSPYINDVRLQKARALIAAGQNDSAIETLSILFKSSGEKPEYYFLLGRAYYEKGLYKNSLSAFHEAARLQKSLSLDSEFYSQSILYSGRIYFIKDDYKSAIKYFEYAVSNGKKYSQFDFNEALQKLIISYNETNQGKKSVELFTALSKNDFDPLFYYTTAVYAAQGYENIKNYQKAYDLYCEVIDAKIESLSVIALKKAYLLADQKKVGVNPGEVFSRNTALFERQPELVCDFWVRLGIDEFDEKNYDLSLEYLLNAENLMLEGVKGDPALISLYRAKIVLETQNDNKALLLEKNEFVKQLDLFKKSKTDNIMDAYYSTMLQFDVLLNNWSGVTALYSQIKNPDSKSAYHAATALYNKGSYSEAQKLLEAYLYDSSCKKLYASCCLRLENAQKAVTFYRELENDGQLDEVSALEYTKALFKTKQYTLSYEKSQKISSPEALYIGSLNLINLRKWNAARDGFNSYIKTASSSKDFQILAFFYKAYAEYNLGEFKNSYASFVRFTNDAPETYVKYIRQSYDFAVKSALQNGDFKSALFQAEKLVKNSSDRADKQQALLLNAQIYADSGNPQKAVEILQPYTNDKSDFALQALYQTAEIYEKMSETLTAEENFEKIITKSPRSTYAEEAAYHMGEMYYSKKDYPAAENRFNKYIYKYADGKYADAALFFCADCNYRLSSYEKAIMLCEVFIKKYSTSIYSYGIYTTLLNSYYDEQDYENALSSANLLLQRFPEQASSDGIGKKVQELKRLVSGSDKQIAMKQNEFEKAGGLKTREGRKTGSELVKLYLRNQETQKAGIELAEQLAELQTASDELELFAQNTAFIAEYNRKNNENTRAAQKYLDAAQAYRSSGNSEKAAESLYSACEAFAAAKLKGDARETAKTLKELYPQSSYAASLDRIIGN